MADANDWLRRVTGQDADEEWDTRPPVKSPLPAPEQPEEDPDAIRVVVDEQGAVTDVVIPARWADAVGGAQGLGAALQEKANDAVARRVADQVANLDMTTMPEPVFAHRDAPSAEGDPDSPVAQNLLAEVMELFGQVDQDLATYSSQVRRAATATYQGSGSASRITVKMAHGQYTEVTVDTRWAAGARHTEIRGEALSAFQAAARQVSTTGAGAVTLPRSLARLQELASDPEALSRQLGAKR
jgi:hypothetical protein